MERHARDVEIGGEADRSAAALLLLLSLLDEDSSDDVTGELLARPLVGDVDSTAVLDAMDGYDAVDEEAAATDEDDDEEELLLLEGRNDEGGDEDEEDGVMAAGEDVDDAGAAVDKDVNEGEMGVDEAGSRVVAAEDDNDDEEDEEDIEDVNDLNNALEDESGGDDAEGEGEDELKPPAPGCKITMRLFPKSVM